MTCFKWFIFLIETTNVFNIKVCMEGIGCWEKGGCVCVCVWPGGGG